MRGKVFLSSVVVLVLLSVHFVVLVKADSLVWSQTYGGTGNEEANSLVATADGGFAIAGATPSFGAGGADFWLAKTDAYGNMEWNKTYGGTEYETAYAVVEAPEGGYVIAGESNSFGGGNEVWLVKTDEYGTMEWNKTYGSTTSFWGCAYALVATADGGYALAGTIYLFC